MERSIRPVTFPSTLSFSFRPQPLCSFFLSNPIAFSICLAPLWLLVVAPICFAPSSFQFLILAKTNTGLKSLPVVAYPIQATRLNIPEPVSIRPKESFHLPLHTPYVSTLIVEINSCLSAILNGIFSLFFNSMPKDAENHTVIRIFFS